MKNLEKIRRKDRIKNNHKDKNHIKENLSKSSHHPKNNIVFCVECGRKKQLYGTETEALRFIKYNSENIENENGYAPCRAYYCPCCSGWHITSRKEYKEPVKSRTDRIIEAYHKDRDDFGLWKEQHRAFTKINLRWDEDTFEYVCVRLTNEARMRLFANIPEEYTHLWDRVYLDHVTLLHKNDYNKDDLGGKAAKVVRYVKNIINNESQSARIHFVVDAIGYNDKAVAFHVNLSVPCNNKTPHITIGTLGDGKPNDSNDIIDWHPIPRISVDGIVEVVYYDTNNRNKAGENNVD